MSETAVKNKESVVTNIKKPSKFKVVVYNDDFTPMEFVVAVLISIFKHNEEVATELTLKIHNEGSAVAGIYTYEIAEQKAIDATEAARNSEYPLQIRVEEM
jgi:ATP-dependent Clp protease adaptor protein ClpS